MAAKKQQQQLLFFGDYLNPMSPCSSEESIDVKKPEAGTEGKGKITRNPFFNYLRLVRIKHPGVRAPDIAIIGANAWNHMTEDEKRPFREQVILAEPKILPISFAKATTVPPFLRAAAKPKPFNRSRRPLVCRDYELPLKFYT